MGRRPPCRGHDDADADGYSAGGGDPFTDPDGAPDRHAHPQPDCHGGTLDKHTDSLGRGDCDAVPDADGYPAAHRESDADGCRCGLLRLPVAAGADSG